MTKLANLIVCSSVLMAPAVTGADDLGKLQQQAFQAAVERVAPSIVRIETIGGLERVGRMLSSSGATTGLVVASDGYIVTSAFNFAQKPSSILVTLADGAKLAARLVATDHSRMLVLLKVDAPQSLPVPQAVPDAQMQVGGWALAVGRALDPKRPNLSVGILSGVKRIWGKAIQTDAKISPVNYGGPLIDLDGRVLGVLVPLSPDSTSEIAGAEWYDSGIGFAIPLTHIEQMLPRLKEGDLRPGLLGVSLKAGSLFGQPATIASVRPNSPAAKAGLKAGDRITAVDGQPVEWLAQLRSRLNPRYAGETIELAVLRGDESLKMSVDLVAELQPYANPFLGILPLRDATAEGIRVRYVYPDSPAATAGLAAGDLLLSLAGQTVNTPQQAWDKFAALEPGQKITIRYRHGDEDVARNVVLATLPVGVAEELPPARDTSKADDAKAQAIRAGRIEIKIPEFANNCLAYVPSTYDSRVAHGVVLWLHGAEGYDKDQLLGAWQSVCDSRDLILVAPQAADPAAWQPAELDFIAKALRQVKSTYSIDPARVVAAGEGVGAVLAYVTAFKERDAIRGVVAVNGAPASAVPENDPIYRLAVYAATAAGSRFAKPAHAAIERFRELKYPVTTKDLGPEDRGLKPKELLEVGRWIDTLDRI
jgi:serine protease Do